MNLLKRFTEHHQQRDADRDLLVCLQNRVMSLDPKQIREWQRLHRLHVPVSLRIVTSPITGDWLVRVDGWEFPLLFPLLYHSLEAAQRAADDVLFYDHPHDCRRAGCGEWGPFQAAGQSAPERPM